MSSLEEKLDLVLEQTEKLELAARRLVDTTEDFRAMGIRMELAIERLGKALKQMSCPPSRANWEMN